MEIHVPHGAIKSVKTFFAHVLTILVGIVLATAVEQYREARHDTHRVEVAARQFREELGKNRDVVRRVQADIAQARENLKAAGTYFAAVDEARRAGRPAPALPENGFSIVGVHVVLRSGAWDTAVATGTLAHFDYEAVQEVSLAYALQREILASQAEYHRALAALSSSRAEYRDGRSARTDMRNMAITRQLLADFEAGTQAFGEQIGKALAKLP